MMKPILIIGQAQSGFERVEGLLNACGMRKPLPSRREGFSPIEISTILRKAYLANQDDAPEPDIQQIEPGSIWHGMALDLMLGNLDQELWGWADPESIHFLEYWKSLDPKITFILVYNDPQTLLTARADASESLTEAGLDAEVDQWCAYNNALLNFFYRNPERCLLVHAQQVGQSASHYLQQVQAQIEMPLASPLHLLDTSPPEEDPRLNAVEDRPESTIETTQEVQLRGDAQPIEVWQALGMEEVEDPLNQYLASDLIDQYTQARQVYEELQSVATLPLAEGPSARHSPLAAWKLMSDLRRRLNQHEDLAHQHEAELANLQKQVEHANQAKTTAEQFAVEQQQKFEETVRTSSQSASQELQEENELLLLQLHQVQEELERYYLENQQLRQGAASGNDADKLPAQKKSAEPTHQPRYGASERVKRQLSYRLGAAMIANHNSVKGWLNMPFALTREVRAFKNEQIQRGDQKLPPISSYYDAYEAERVKQHLSYRLGAAMIAHHKSPIGWMKMPWILAGEVKDFKRRRAGKR